MKQSEIVTKVKNALLLDIAVAEYHKSLIAKLTEYKKSLIYEVVTGKKEV